VTIAISQAKWGHKLRPLWNTATGGVKPPIGLGGLALTIAPATLTFTPDDWNIPQTVTVTAAANPSSKHPFALDFLVNKVTSTDPNYNHLKTPEIFVSTGTPLPVKPVPVASSHKKH